MNSTEWAAEPTGAGAHLLAVHGHFRAELTRLQDIVGRVRAGALDPGSARSEVNAMALRANAWVLGSFCQSFCFAITQHHTLEDTAVFTHLGARDPSLVPVLERLGAELIGPLDRLGMWGE